MATKDSMSDPLGSVQFSIVNGPSTNAFVDALKYAYGKTRATTKMTIMLSASEQRVIELQIVSISHEDESGHSFTFRAYVKSNSALAGLIDGYYNSNTKKGYVVVKLS